MADQQQNSAPPKCAAGCGFFGNTACENYCSKCYRDRKEREPAVTSADAAASAATAATAASAAAAATASVAAAAAAAAAAPPAPVAPAPALEEPVPMDATPDQPASQTNTPKKRKQRCAVCSVKLGMLGFECRCESLFCSKHRFADQHECSFDFKTHDREVLAANNPQVAPSKLNAL